MPSIQNVTLSSDGRPRDSFRRHARGYDSRQFRERPSSRDRCVRECAASRWLPLAPKRPGMGGAIHEAESGRCVQRDVGAGSPLDHGGLLRDARGGAAVEKRVGSAEQLPVDARLVVALEVTEARELDQVRVARPGLRKRSKEQVVTDRVEITDLEAVGDERAGAVYLSFKTFTLIPLRFAKPMKSATIRK